MPFGAPTIYCCYTCAPPKEREGDRSYTESMLWQPFFRLELLKSSEGQEATVM